MKGTVGRRLLAEFIGTGLLMAIVVGSGIFATRLTPDPALLLINSLVTAMGLAVLILVFISANGAQFNPVVTAVDWILGRRTSHRYGLGEAAAVIGCQVAGAIGGAAVADTMFNVIRQPGRNDRPEPDRGAIGAALAVILYPLRAEGRAKEAQLAG